MCYSLFRKWMEALAPHMVCSVLVWSGSLKKKTNNKNDLFHWGRTWSSRKHIDLFTPSIRWTAQFVNSNIDSEIRTIKMEWCGENTKRQASTVCGASEMQPVERTNARIACLFLCGTVHFCTIVHSSILQYDPSLQSTNWTPTRSSSGISFEVAPRRNSANASFKYVREHQACGDLVAFPAAKLYTISLAWPTGWG